MRRPLITADGRQDARHRRTIAAALRRLVRRATADYAFRIRHRHGLFEIHERSRGAWRVRGLFLAYDDAERVADALVRERSRGEPVQRRLGAVQPPDSPGEPPCRTAFWRR